MIAFQTPLKLVGIIPSTVRLWITPCWTRLYISLNKVGKPSPWEVNQLSKEIRGKKKILFLLYTYNTLSFCTLSIVIKSMFISFWKWFFTELYKHCYIKHILKNWRNYSHKIWKSLNRILPVLFFYLHISYFSVLYCKHNLAIWEQGKVNKK